MSAEPFFLTLQSCTVRDWVRGDEHSIVRHANNRNVWLGVRDVFPHPYTIADARGWIGVATTTLRGEAFAIEVGGFAVGAVSLRGDEDINRFSAEIGFWLGEDHWGGGIMTEVVGAMIEYGFTELGYHRIFAHVFEGNDASVRVLEKAGFQLEGRLRGSAFKAGTFLDEMIYAVLQES